MNRHPGVSVRWVETRSRASQYEVFTIDGVEYVRTPTPELADKVLDGFSKGLGKLYLKRRDKVTAHLRGRAAREEKERQQFIAAEETVAQPEPPQEVA